MLLSGLGRLFMHKADYNISSNELVARNIRYFRESYGWTQLDLAEIIGVSRERVSDIERIRTGLSLKLYDRLRQAFHLPHHELLLRHPVAAHRAPEKRLLGTPSLRKNFNDLSKA